jgi:hypothetical protein
MSSCEHIEETSDSLKVEFLKRLDVNFSRMTLRYRFIYDDGSYVLIPSSGVLEKLIVT